jgi:hypothetical protein
MNVEIKDRITIQFIHHKAHLEHELARVKLDHPIMTHYINFTESNLTETNELMELLK